MTKPRDLANSVNSSSIPGVRLENDAITASKMAANSVDSSELANDAVSTGKIQNNAITTAKIASANVTTAKLAFDCGPLSGFRNLIINGNPAINQRAYVSGTATGGANQYTLDRWRVVTSGQNLAFTTSNGVVTCTAPAGGVEQVIEGASILGGTHVLSWVGTATATVNGSAVTNGGTVSLTGGSNATVRFSGGTFSYAQLEFGTVATPFERRPYGVELMLCRRYYQTVSGVGLAGGFTTTTGYIGAGSFATEMRDAPVGTRVGDLAVNDTAAVLTSSAADQSLVTSTTGYRVTNNGFSGATINQPAVGNGTSIQYTFTAEL